MPHCFLTKQTEKLQEFFLKKYDHPDSCHSLSVTQMLFFLHIQAPTSVPCWADQNMPAWALRCTSSSLPCTLTLVWTPLTAPRRPLRLGEVKCQGVLNEKWQVWLFFFSCKAFSCCCCFFFCWPELAPRGFILTAIFFPCCGVFEWDEQNVTLKTKKMETIKLRWLSSALPNYMLKRGEWNVQSIHFTPFSCLTVSKCCLWLLGLWV